MGVASPDNVGVTIADAVLTTALVVPVLLLLLAVVYIVAAVLASEAVDVTCTGPVKGYQP